MGRHVWNIEPNFNLTTDLQAIANAFPIRRGTSKETTAQGVKFSTQEVKLDRRKPAGWRSKQTVVVDFDRCLCAYVMKTVC